LSVVLEPPLLLSELLLQPDAMSTTAASALTSATAFLRVLNMDSLSDAFRGPRPLQLDPG
jgi:hypothetical protein